MYAQTQPNPTLRPPIQLNPCAHVLFFSFLFFSFFFSFLLQYEFATKPVLEAFVQHLTLTLHNVPDDQSLPHFAEATIRGVLRAIAFVASSSPANLSIARRVTLRTLLVSKVTYPLRPSLKHSLLTALVAVCGLGGPSSRSSSSSIAQNLDDEKENEANTAFKEEVSKLLVDLLNSDVLVDFYRGATALSLLLEASPDVGKYVVTYGYLDKTLNGDKSKPNAAEAEEAEEESQSAVPLYGLLAKTDSSDEKAKVR